MQFIHEFKKYAKKVKKYKMMHRLRCKQHRRRNQKDEREEKNMKRHSVVWALSKKIKKVSYECEKNEANAIFWILV